ncbi:hypothetical protein, partial [Stenotrophomonas maltophilia]|uniref:hypothetical protein n=1 Tax=Stenotrophomonas maltophilia TaxID=40324 RepID=UPI001B7D7AD1
MPAFYARWRVRQGCALHLLTGQINVKGNNRLWSICVFGGAVWDGRTRRKPIHGGSMAPSMAPTVLPSHTA